LIGERENKMNDLILREKEIRQKIVNIINNSGLPAILVKPMLKDFLEQVEVLEQKQYQEALRKKDEEAAENNEHEQV